jgi:hypothetical protein
MSDVLVRQWGPNCYAAYVVGDGRYPDFVGTAETREAAELLCPATDPNGESDVSEQVSGEEWTEQSDGPRWLNTPARPPLTSPGATP